MKLYKIFEYFFLMKDYDLPNKVHQNSFDFAANLSIDDFDSTLLM